MSLWFSGTFTILRKSLSWPYIWFPYGDNLHTTCCPVEFSHHTKRLHLHPISEWLILTISWAMPLFGPPASVGWFAVMYKQRWCTAVCKSCLRIIFHLIGRLLTCMYVCMCTCTQACVCVPIQRTDHDTRSSFSWDKNSWHLFHVVQCLYDCTRKFKKMTPLPPPVPPVFIWLHKEV